MEVSMDSKQMQENFIKKVVFFNKYVVLTEDYEGDRMGWERRLFDDPPKLGNYYVYYFGKDGKNFVQVEEGNEFLPQLEEIYIIKEIDDKFIYLIKNGENKVVKFNKIQGDYSPLDLVYLRDDKLIKDQTFTKYFKEFLSKFNQKVTFDKNNFKMHRYLVESFLDHGVSLCELDDIHALTFIPDYELNGNYVTGDIYIKIELGKNCLHI